MKITNSKTTGLSGAGLTLFTTFAPTEWFSTELKTALALVGILLLGAWAIPQIKDAFYASSRKRPKMIAFVIIISGSLFVCLGLWAIAYGINFKPTNSASFGKRAVNGQVNSKLVVADFFVEEMPGGTGIVTARLKITNVGVLPGDQPVMSTFLGFSDKPLSKDEAQKQLEALRIRVLAQPRPGRGIAEVQPQETVISGEAMPFQSQVWQDVLTRKAWLNVAVVLLSSDSATPEKTYLITEFAGSQGADLSRQSVIFSGTFFHP